MANLFNKKQFFAGDTFQLVNLPASIVMPEITRRDYIYGSVRLAGEVIQVSQSPLYVVQLVSNIPRVEYSRAYEVAFNVLVYCKTNETRGNVETALYQELSEKEQAFRSTFERCHVDGDVISSLNGDQQQAIHYIDDIAWQGTTFSESFYGDDESARLAYAYADIQWLLTTETLPYDI